MQALADNMPNMGRKIENMMLDAITDVLSDRPYNIALGEFIDEDIEPTVR